MYRFVSLIMLIPCLHDTQNPTHDRVQLAAVGFWNVENLYDTINDPKRNDDEFTPDGINAWTGERYRTKISRLAETLAQIAAGQIPRGLAVAGLCEVENKSVLNDLVSHPALSPRGYRIVHFDGPDPRGVDPALIYDPRSFTVKKAWSRRVRLVTDSLHRTRDILVVAGELGGAHVTFIVNHWPSRRGGEVASRPNRNAAAVVVRAVSDSLLAADPENRIIIMGDFNDDPDSPSIRDVLRASGSGGPEDSRSLFNPMDRLFRDGTGSLAWQDSWNLFDQFIISRNLNGPGQNEWRFHAAYVFNKPFLRSDFGNFRGYPFRTFSGGIYTGGFSDHFPVYILLTRKISP